jgi:two-component system invasion response regulator UvrY
MSLFLAESHVAVGNAGQPFSVLLADDHQLALVRNRRTLNDVTEFDVVGEAESVGRLLELVATQTPNAVVMDLEMNGSAGLRCLADLRRQWADVVVVAVSATGDPKRVRKALKAGASACIAQSAAAAELVTVLREALGAAAFTAPTEERRDGCHVTTTYGRRGVEFGVARAERGSICRVPAVKPDQTRDGRAGGL